MSPRTLLLAALLLGSTLSAQSWQQARPTASPPPRQGHGMAWDAGRERIVLFGGYDWGRDRHYQDHWEHDGDVWIRLATNTAPSPRMRAGMCYDERRGVVVLFGGLRTTTFGSPTWFGDTWEFDGSDWRQVAPAGSSPSPRFADLAYDPVRGVVVLFGGTDNTRQPRNDTWEYDGVRWTLRTPAATPPARPDYALAFDRRRGRLVAQPGYVMGHSTQMVTWEWDGNAWAQATHTILPPPFPEPSMTYDARRQRVVLVGATFAAPQETWEFDGTDWRRAGPAEAVNVGLVGHQLAYDAHRGAVVRFGGEEEIGGFTVATDETWDYAMRAGYEPFGTACAAAGTPPMLAARAGSTPRTGSTLVSQVTNLPANGLVLMLLGTDRTLWNGVPLPLDLGLVGLGGCELLTSIDVALPLTNRAGTAEWMLPIPADPQLHGGVLHSQALVLDATLGPVAVSNGAILTVGL